MSKETLLLTRSIKCQSAFLGWHLGWPVRYQGGPVPTRPPSGSATDQVGWEASVHSHFQISPEMFNRVQVWALAGPLMDIHTVVPKPLLFCLGCVLRVVVFTPIFTPV